MDARRYPAAVPAVGVLLGAWLAPAASVLPPLGLLALLGLAAALGRRTGLLLGGLVLGALAVVARSPEPAARWATLDRERPVVVEGRVARPWWRTEWGWRSTLEPSRARQGRRILFPAEELRVDVTVAQAPPPMGTKVRVRGYLRQVQGYANRLPVPPGPPTLRAKTLRHLEIVEPPSRFARLVEAARSRVEEALLQGRPQGAGAAASPGPALARALVLGDSSELTPEWRRGLRRSGLSHLLAVSGLHVALVAGLAWLVTAPLPPPLRVALSGAAVFGYLLLVGPRPSLLRAVAMVWIAGIAQMSGRGRCGGNALALAAAALALENPSWVREVGFQLTVAATAGIVFAVPWLESRWRPWRSRRRPRAMLLWLRRSLCATLCAQAASLPFALPVFHLAAWTAPALNLLAVPYTAMTLAASLLWVGLAVVWPLAAEALVPGLDALAAPFGWPASGPPSLWGTMAVEGGGAVGVVGLAGLAAGLAALASQNRRIPSSGGGWRRLATTAGENRRLAGCRRRRWLTAASLTAAVAGVAWWVAGGGRAAGEPALRISLLDVGQGDAVLLQDGPHSLLVDGGGWRHGDFGGRVLLPALLGEGVRRLDAVVASHGDLDHCGGLVEVASYLPVREVWLGPDWYRSACTERLAALAGWPGVSRVELAAGSRRRLGRWTLSVLHPRAAAPARVGAERRNDRSLVLLAEGGGRRVLLTGDLYRSGEREMVRGWGGIPFPVDVLKVGHHGSGTSTGRELLAAVRPRVALISAGANSPYGHPAPAVVERLEQTGARVLSTGRVGQISLYWRPGGPIRFDLPAGLR